MSIDFIDAVPKYRLVCRLRTHKLSCTFYVLRLYRSYIVHICFEGSTALTLL